MITVVVPMFNSERTILNTLNSIVNQTFIHKISEIIIVNDGSTDNSKKIVLDFIEKSNKASIRLIDTPNKGVSSARNIGIENSSSEWIALIDSDDEWLPNKIEYQTKLIELNSDIDFIGGPYNNKPLKIVFRKITKLHKAKVWEMCIKNYPQPSTVIFKKKIYDDIGGFDTGQRYAEDGNYFVNICSKYSVYYDPNLLITYDSGKRGYGRRGLSSNLKMMYKGNVKNLKDFRINGIINCPFYIILRIFYFIKYIRRIIITKIT